MHAASAPAAELPTTTRDPTGQSLYCRRPLEVTVEFLRAHRENRYSPVINDPQPLGPIEDVWGSAAQMATVGIFFLLLVTCLHFAQAILLPVVAAALIATTF